MDTNDRNNAAGGEAQQVTGATPSHADSARYWISWYQPTDDCRPLTHPPNEAILGWWLSGDSERGSTLCALVVAANERQAKRSVLKDWPEAKDWRFCDPRASDFLPGDRFVLAEWMTKRLTPGPPEGVSAVDRISRSES